MRITEAAQRLGISPRMLRYRESLGLLPAVRESLPGTRPRLRAAGAGPGAPGPGAGQHRQFSENDLGAVAVALEIEHRYDISPAELAFGLRVLAEPGVRAEVAELGRRIGRFRPPAVRALDFEQERALRLLNMPGPGQSRPGARQPRPGPGQPRPGRRRAGEAGTPGG